MRNWLIVVVLGATALIMVEVLSNVGIVDIDTTPNNPVDIDDDLSIFGRPVMVAQLYESGVWKYHQITNDPGTRSKGLDGWLLKDCILLKGSTIGETIDTPWGMLYWHGLERKYPWNPIGWQMFRPVV